MPLTEQDRRNRQFADEYEEQFADEEQPPPPSSSPRQREGEDLAETILDRMEVGMGKNFYDD